MARQRSGLIVLVVLAIASCSKPSADDLARLEILKDKWGGKYVFVLGAPPYMYATAKAGVDVNEAELAAALTEFLLDFGPTRSRRSSLYVYLNVYRANDVFEFQLYLQDGEIRKSRREFY